MVPLNLNKVYIEYIICGFSSKGLDPCSVNPNLVPSSTFMNIILIQLNFCQDKNGLTLILGKTNVDFVLGGKKKTLNDAPTLSLSEVRKSSTITTIPSADTGLPTSQFPSAHGATSLHRCRSTTHAARQSSSPEQQIAPPPAPFHARLQAPL